MIKPREEVGETPRLTCNHDISQVHTNVPQDPKAPLCLYHLTQKDWQEVAAWSTSHLKAFGTPIPKCSTWTNAMFAEKNGNRDFFKRMGHVSSPRGKLTLQRVITQRDIIGLHVFYVHLQQVYESWSYSSSQVSTSVFVPRI